MKETYKNGGIPLTVITKETVQAKDGDNKIKKKEVLQTLNNKNDCLFKINFQYLNHHRNIKDKMPDSTGILNAQLTEHRTEEHHEERVGTNKF